MDKIKTSLLITNVLPDGSHSLDSWCEEYYLVDPKKDAKAIIDYFNKTLRPGERPRVLLEVNILDGEDNSKMPHDWEKTNLVTVVHGGSSFDTYRCTRCKITGKRRGFDSGIVRDGKYRYKKYDYCGGNNG